jgi:hypothetical protein
LERAGTLYGKPGGPDMLAYAASGDRILYSLEPFPATDTSHLGTHLIAQVEGTPIFRHHP